MIISNNNNNNKVFYCCIKKKILLSLNCSINTVQELVTIMVFSERQYLYFVLDMNS